MAYDYEIEDNVEMPEKHFVEGTPPFSEMEVGQSVVFDLRRRHVIQTLASAQKKKYGRVFSCRKINETQGRCWRIE